MPGSSVGECKDLLDRRGEDRAHFVVARPVHVESGERAEHGRYEELRRFEETADHAGLLASSSMIDAPHALESARPDDVLGDRHLDAVASPEFVLIGEGHEQDVAGRYRSALAGRKLDRATP